MTIIPSLKIRECKDELCHGNKLLRGGVENLRLSYFITVRSAHITSFSLKLITSDFERGNETTTVRKDFKALKRYNNILLNKKL